MLIYGSPTFQPSCIVLAAHFAIKANCNIAARCWKVDFNWPAAATRRGLSLSIYFALPIYTYTEREESALLYIAAICMHIHSDLNHAVCIFADENEYKRKKVRSSCSARKERVQKFDSMYVISSVQFWQSH
jgi:hypothetical protein